MIIESSIFISPLASGEHTAGATKVKQYKKLIIGYERDARTSITFSEL